MVVNNPLERSEARVSSFFKKGLPPVGTTYLRPDDWQWMEVVSGQGIIGSREVPDAELVPLNLRKVPWVNVVLSANRYISSGSARDLVEQGLDLPPLDIAHAQGEPFSILRRLFSYTKALSKPQITRAELRETEEQKIQYLKKLSDEIRAKNRQSLILDTLQAITQFETPENKTTSAMIINDVRALYLLAGTENRFLAGFDGRDTVWKNVELPPLYFNVPIPLTHIAAPTLSSLGLVTQRELPIVPRRIIGPKDYKKIEIPPFAEDREDILAEAILHPDYSLRPGVNSVELLDAGSLQAMHLILAGPQRNVLFARTETPFGDLATIIDLATGRGFSTDLTPTLVRGDLNFDNPIEGSLLATQVLATYRALVCAEEVPWQGFRRLAAPMSATLERARAEGRNSGPSIRYVPQIRRTGQPIEPRPPHAGPHYEMPRILSRAYTRVQGTGLTDRQESRIQPWEAKYGLTAPKPDKSIGETVCLPNIEGTAANLPPILKRRVQARIDKMIKESRERRGDPAP